MSFFIIKHKASGEIMPMLGRGSTYWEPVVSSRMSEKQKKKHLHTPRLFARKSDAANSIRWWAEGRWRNDPEDGMPIKVQDQGLAVLRRPSQLEIIEVELKEIGQMELAL